MTATLEAALAYAARGWQVFPVKRDKTPWTGNGFKDATDDPERIASFWRRHPDAGIGIATGVTSGIVVLDEDTPKGGAGGRAELEKRIGKLPATYEVLTGGGGRHFYYAHPGPLVPCSAGQLATGVDVRGDGGYVVAAGSPHTSGRRYKLLHDRDLAPWPLALLNGAARERKGRATTVGDVIPQGQRDATLTSIAGTMRRRAMSEAEILAALRVANEQRCRPPLPDKDVERIAASIATKTPAASTPKEQQTESARRVLQARPLEGVAMRSIEWLEKPLWQTSAFQLLAGAKGAGKGTYIAGLAARVSRSGRNVLFVSTEDSAEIDLKPRLVAAGADIGRCFDIPLHVQLPDDIYALQKLAREIGGVGLFVIDPVANHIGDRNSNGDGEVRDAIAPLNWLANELGCLLIGVRHPGKDRSRGALASILGSTAWIDTPRAVVMIAADDVDPDIRVIQVVAGNRSRNGAAQAFRIDAVNVPGLAEPITLAVELGESGKSVDDLLAVSKDTSKSATARELILDILEGEGEQESDALDARVAQETGLSARTTRDVRMTLSQEGLAKSHPDKDESGAVTRWKVSRSGAPRP